jgi:hypothetical protein
MSGFYRNGPGNDWNFLALQVDTNGVVLNHKVYSFAAMDDSGFGFYQASDYGYMFTVGYAVSGHYEYCLFKTDSAFNSCKTPMPNLTFTTTDVTSLTHVTPITFNVSPLDIIIDTGVYVTTNQPYTILTDCEGYIGIDEQKKNENDILIFPNPGTTMLQVQGASFKNSDYIITNVLGETVFSGKGETEQDEISINISTLKSGIYFLNLYDGSKNCAKKFIKVE